MTTALDQTRFNHPLLIGHRGYPARYPENTLSAFEGAIQAGCDMIELDVTLTKDRQVVVIHDDTLNRTTTGNGPVADRVFEEIKELDAGSWFDGRFAGERVPALSEVIRLTAGRCMLNIEIKESALETDYPADGIEHQVVGLVKTYKAMDRVIISSFDRRILQRIAAMNEPLAIACISNCAADKNILEILLAIKAFSWHPWFKALTSDQVETLHASGLKVFPWTINTRAEAQKILSMGVDGLICNEMQAMQAD